MSLSKYQLERADLTVMVEQGRRVETELFAENSRGLWTMGELLKARMFGSTQWAINLRKRMTNYSLGELFWARVNKTTGCWLWTGSIRTDGYGQFWNGQRNVKAHRFAYEDRGREIPDGLELDHLCRNRACVNPDHLEPVTHLTNIRRGNSGAPQRARTHCPRGHEYSPENTYTAPGQTKRGCRTCRIEASKRHRDVQGGNGAASSSDEASDSRRSAAPPEPHQWPCGDPYCQPCDDAVKRLLRDVGVLPRKGGTR